MGTEAPLPPYGSPESHGEPEETKPEKPEIKDFIGSFTGWDEEAIHRMFRRDFSDLSAMMTGRAACFILFRRQGMADRDSFKKAMDLPLREVDELFDTSAAKAEEDGRELSDEERWELEGKG